MSDNKIGNITVLGLGAVGVLAATLLHDSGFSVTGVDARLPDRDLAFATRACSVAAEAELRELLTAQDAVLSCLPYSLNKAVARLASIVISPQRMT